MNDVKNSGQATSGRSISQWLFNPFRFMAGYKALLLGLGFILVSAFIGSLGNTHFDGVLDVHTGMEAPLWYFFAEGIIDWLAIAIPLFFFGLIVSSSSLRMIDVFGTQALARWPYLITSFVMLPEANRRVGAYLMAKFTTGNSLALSFTDMAIFGFAMFMVIVMVVWMVALMYRAYAVSCNIKGAKAIVTFIISLLMAEIVSKVLILALLSGTLGTDAVMGNIMPKSVQRTDVVDEFENDPKNGKVIFS